MSLIAEQPPAETLLEQRGRELLIAASPKTAAAINKLEIEAAALSAAADEKFEAHVTGTRRIETLLARASKLSWQIERLNHLANIHEAAAANGSQAVEYYLVAQEQVEPSAVQNWTTLTDEMQRAATVSPFIPAAIKERETELAQNRAEVEKLSTEHGIDVAALIAALQKQRRGFENIVYIATPR